MNTCPVIAELERKLEFMEVSRDALIRLYKEKIDEARALQREVSVLQQKLEHFERSEEASQQNLRRLSEQLEVVQTQSEVLNNRISALESQPSVGAHPENAMIEAPRLLSIRNRTITRLQIAQRSMSVEVMGSSSEEMASPSNDERDPVVRENRTSRLRTQQIIFQRARSSSACGHGRRRNLN